MQVVQLVESDLQPWQLTSQLPQVFDNKSANVFVGQELWETHVFVELDKNVEFEQDVQVNEFVWQLKQEGEQDWHLLEVSE